jgi:hypothetical protein
MPKNKEAGRQEDFDLKSTPSDNDGMVIDVENRG